MVSESKSWYPGSRKPSESWYVDEDKAKCIKVDKNSAGWVPNEGLQDNGVYTCSGGDECYRNTYPGAYYQYGCGASEDATSVETTYSGQAPDMLLQVVFTGVNFSPVTAATSAISPSPSNVVSVLTLPSSTLPLLPSSYSISRSSTSHGSIPSTTLGTFKSSSSTEIPSIAVAGKATATSAEATSASTDPSDKGLNKGSLIAACIGGILGLAAIVGFALWFGRRRRQRKEARALSFVIQHHGGKPQNPGPFQRIRRTSPDDFSSRKPPPQEAVSAITASLPGSENEAQPTQHVPRYASIPSQQSPPLSPSRRRSGSSAGLGAFYNGYPPSPTRRLTPQAASLETKEFPQRPNSTAQAETDTHAHVGDLPTATAGAPMLLRGGSGGSPRTRRPEWSITTEALRAQRPRTSSMRIKPAGWCPRGLSVRERSAQIEASNGDSSPEWIVPPRSPMREKFLASVSATIAGSESSRESVSDGVQRYRLVDEVVGEDVPILRSPAQFRQNRTRRESSKM
ncbi:unnamed protein product [Diplocarpon coronariae]|uniref:Uncharacterized protein n=1 Tax=Diplocarpon coronariae TaxID=2795749 RepID=A0A218Z1V3_9HELO|nr:hypothetical protein B2J93_7055 [Marssonina coronariae]